MRKKQYHRKPKLAKHVCGRCGFTWKDYSIEDTVCSRCGVQVHKNINGRSEKEGLSFEGKCTVAFMEMWFLVIGIGVAILLVLSTIWINKGV